MPKEKKIIRTKRIYKKRHRPKWFGTFLFILFLLVLVGLGYLVSREWSEFFSEGDGGAVSSPSSAPESEVSSELPVSSEAVSSETMPAVSSEPSILSPENIRGIVMPAEAMQSTGDALTAYLDALKTEGYNAVCIDLKTEAGMVTYQTSVGEARLFGAVGTTPIDLDALVRAVKGVGLTPVARISALRDSIAPHVSRENSYGYDGSTEVNWLDDSAANGGKPWLNPYMPKARDYVAGFCAEAAGKGFEAIFLTNVNFPTKNTTAKMGTFSDGTKSREEILSLLMEECQKAAGSVPVLNCYDAAWAYSAASHDTPYRNGGGGVAGRRAPLLNLDRLAANKGAICIQIGMLTESGAVPEAEPAVILEALLDAGDFPIIRQSDLPTILPVLEKKGIKSYLVY